MIMEMFLPWTRSNLCSKLFEKILWALMMLQDRENLVQDQPSMKIPAIWTRTNLILVGNNMVTQFNGHQVEYQYIDPITALIIMF